MKFRDIVNHLEYLQKRKMYTSLIQGYNKFLLSHPDHLMFINYNLACVYHTEIGDGEMAKPLYLSVVSEWRKIKSKNKIDNKASKVFKTIYANACENLASLSCSYDEFFNWSDEVKSISPDEILIVETVPLVKDFQRKGLPWSKALIQLATIFFHPDPSKDKGMYGFAAAMYQLLITQARKLRTDRQDLAIAGVAFGNLRILIISKMGEYLDRNRISIDPNELLFIIDNTQELIRKLKEQIPSISELDKLNATLDALESSKLKFVEKKRTFKTLIWLYFRTLIETLKYFWRTRHH